jgi:hypothetical protein
MTKPIHLFVLVFQNIHHQWFEVSIPRSRNLKCKRFSVGKRTSWTVAVPQIACLLVVNVALSMRHGFNGSFLANCFGQILVFAEVSALGSFGLDLIPGFVSSFSVYFVSRTERTDFLLFIQVIHTFFGQNPFEFFLSASQDNLFWNLLEIRYTKVKR